MALEASAASPVTIGVSDFPAPSAGTESKIRPLALEKLPIGSIEPQGWLLRQLELQRDGLNGHLSEISAWLEKSNNAWMVEGAHNGWEELPYWLRGYSRLAYILNDESCLLLKKYTATMPTVPIRHACPTGTT